MHLILYNEKFDAKEFKCSFQTRSVLQMHTDHFMHLSPGDGGIPCVVMGEHVCGDGGTLCVVWWCIPAETGLLRV